MVASSLQVEHVTEVQSAYLLEKATRHRQVPYEPYPPHRGFTSDPVRHHQFAQRSNHLEAAKFHVLDKDSKAQGETVTGSTVAKAVL